MLCHSGTAGSLPEQFHQLRPAVATERRSDGQEFLDREMIERGPPVRSGEAAAPYSREQVLHAGRPHPLEALPASNDFVPGRTPGSAIDFLVVHFRFGAGAMLFLQHSRVHAVGHNT